MSAHEDDDLALQPVIEAKKPEPGPDDIIAPPKAGGFVPPPIAPKAAPGADELYIPPPPKDEKKPKFDTKSVADEYMSEAVIEEQHRWASIMLFCGLFCIIHSIGALITVFIWLAKKAHMPFLETVGKDAINFHFLPTIVMVLLSVSFGDYNILVYALKLFTIVFLIIAGLQVNKGERFKYPYTLKIIP